METAPTFRKSPLYVFVAATIALWGLHAAKEFIVPVLLAGLLAFLIVPAARALRRLKLPEWICVLASAILILLPLAGVAYLVVNQVQALVENWPKLRAALIRALDNFRQGGLATRFHLTAALNPAILRSSVEAHFGSELLVALTSLEKLLRAGSLLVLVVFFAVAMLASRRHLKSSFDLILASYTAFDSKDTAGMMARMMESFLIARTSIAVGMGLASFLVLLGFGVPYGILLGAFIGFMTWVPIVGFIAGIIPTLIVGFASGKNWGAMLVVFGIIGGIWIIQDHVITPKWVGHRLKLNFLATYLAFFAGGLLWGAWGMILSIPLLGLIRIACSASPKLRPWAFALGEDDTPLTSSGTQASEPNSPSQAA